MNKLLPLLLLLPLMFGSFTKTQTNLPRKGKDYALFFAVNNYESGLDALKMPISDAEKIAAELTDNFGFTCEIVRNPKLSEIQKKLNEYRMDFANGRRDRSGQLFIYFTGHGKVEYDEGYFLPSDSKTDFLSGSSMSYSIYRKMMDNIPCKHLLVAIDACYSGTFDPKYGAKYDPLFGTRQGELGERDKLLIEHDKNTTRLFFTSAATDQTTPDRSSFAKKLLEALKSRGGEDDILTSSEAYTFLENASPRPRRGEFGSDEAGSSFLFVAENTRHTIDKPIIASRLPYEPEMFTVQGGTFQMGDVMGDNEYDNEKPIHSVTLSSFEIGKYEVTQAQWQAVMGNNPSNFKGDNLPVEQVSWEDVQEYLTKLNQKTGKKYRLPTEAEWEYAAREGGKKVRFGNGKDIANPSEINFNGSKDYKKPYSVVGVYKQKTTPVGSFGANSLGLYDMSGNVREWCNDWYSSYDSGSASNPTGAAAVSNRVIRGGSWFSYPQYCRTAYRGNYTPTYRYNFLGFRVVSVPH